MNISKIIVCAVSFASVGFAVENDYTENRSVGSRGSVVKPVKRAMPKGGDVSANKSKPGVDRQALVDVTNTVDTRLFRERKPNPKYKATAEVINTRKIVKAKRSKAKSPTAVVEVLSDDSSGHTTPVEGSIGSRTSSFESSFVLGKDDPVNELDRSFGDYFGFDFDEEEGVDPRATFLASPVATRQTSSAVVETLIPGTPTAEDWLLALAAAGQDATPFTMGGSYKGQIYTPFDPATYTDLLFDAAKLEVSPISKGEFDRLISEMYPNAITF